jgi:hypothetical protein
MVMNTHEAITTLAHTAASGSSLSTPAWTLVTSQSVSTMEHPLGVGDTEVVATQAAASPNKWGTPSPLLATVTEEMRSSFNSIAPQQPVFDSEFPLNDDGAEDLGDHQTEELTKSICAEETGEIAMDEDAGWVRKAVLIANNYE